MKKDILIVELEIKVEKREGYYAASTKPFAITAYGNNIEEAEKRARQAVELLLSTYSKTSKELTDYLELHVVDFTFQTMEQPELNPIVKECKRKMRVKVSASV